MYQINGHNQLQSHTSTDQCPQSEMTLLQDHVLKSYDYVQASCLREYDLWGHTVGRGF